MISWLNRLFKKDSTITKCQALETFMTFRGPSSMFILAFLNEFEKQLLKSKSYSSTMSDDVLVHWLLKSSNFSNFSNYHEDLIKATITEIQVDIMKDQLKKTFIHAFRQIPTKTEYIIKPTFPQKW